MLGDAGRNDHVGGRRRADPRPGDRGGSHLFVRQARRRQPPCWGENGSAQLGNGFFESQSTPVTVVSASGARFIGSVLAAGAMHACTRTNFNGGARCWGANTNGQTGDTDRTGFRPAPVTVIDQGLTALTNIVALTAGAGHSCALLASGRAKCWGSNSRGQLGDGSTNAPIRPQNTVFVRTATGILESIKAIAAGNFHTCALIANGSVRCWGAMKRARSQEQRDPLSSRLSKSSRRGVWPSAPGTSTPARSV
jgi:alpha-tubulin suppressor-like RCC1 family protein